jgi:hypothetical protein
LWMSCERFSCDGPAIHPGHSKIHYQ